MSRAVVVLAVLLACVGCMRSPIPPQEVSVERVFFENTDGIMDAASTADALYAITSACQLLVYEWRGERAVLVDRISLRDFALKLAVNETKLVVLGEKFVHVFDFMEDALRPKKLGAFVNAHSMTDVAVEGDWAWFSSLSGAVYRVELKSTFLPKMAVMGVDAAQTLAMTADVLVVGRRDGRLDFYDKPMDPTAPPVASVMASPGVFELEMMGDEVVAVCGIGGAFGARYEGGKVTYFQRLSEESAFSAGRFAGKLFFISGEEGGRRIHMVEKCDGTTSADAGRLAGFVKRNGVDVAVYHQGIGPVVAALKDVIAIEPAAKTVNLALLRTERGVLAACGDSLVLLSEEIGRGVEIHARYRWNEPMTWHWVGNSGFVGVNKSLVATFRAGTDSELERLDFEPLEASPGGVMRIYSDGKRVIVVDTRRAHSVLFTMDEEGKLHRLIAGGEEIGLRRVLFNGEKLYGAGSKKVYVLTIEKGIFGVSYSLDVPDMIVDWTMAGETMVAVTQEGMVLGFDVKNPKKPWLVDEKQLPDTDGAGICHVRSADGFVYVSKPLVGIWKLKVEPTGKLRVLERFEYRERIEDFQVMGENFIIADGWRTVVARVH